jgi:hypothetical protein
MLLHTLNSLQGPISVRISVTCYLSDVETADSFDCKKGSSDAVIYRMSENWRLQTQPRDSLINVKNKM